MTSLKRPSICFVIPYFGRWPFWMPFFLESCRHNPDIHWRFYSDCGTPENLPPNVTVQAVDYSAYCQQVSERLGIHFRPESPYKLCDLKPALGYIHGQDIRDFDFWAFGDIDLVYGNLRNYFTDEKLQRLDLLSTHERRVSGHLCLLRNSERMRTAFMRVPRWREMFEDQKHHAFDEGPFSRIFLWRKNFPRPLFNLVGKLNPWRRKSEFREAFSTPGGKHAWTDGSRDFPQAWYWRPGRLTTDRDGEREFPYFHFFIWKRSWKPGAEPAILRSPPSPLGIGWKIDSQGFHPLDN